jgi:hypothetical protein
VSHQLLEDFAHAPTGDSLADELLGLTRVYFDSVGRLAPLTWARLALWATGVAMLRGVALHSVFDDEIDLPAARNEIERMIIDRTRRDTADDGGRGL